MGGIVAVLGSREPVRAAMDRRSPGQVGKSRSGKARLGSPGPGAGADLTPGREKTP